MGGGARRHHAGPDGVAALLGGALQGIVGALVAIPAAAALLLLTQEVLIARLDHT
jgi:predicted PurR-regulated permease PerM